MPATPLYQRLQREGRLLAPQWWIDPAWRFGAPTFTPAGMTAERLSAACFDARRAFYAWRHVLSRVARPALRRDGFLTGAVALANVISRREVLRKHGHQLGEAPAPEQGR